VRTGAKTMWITAGFAGLAVLVVAGIWSYPAPQGDAGSKLPFSGTPKARPVANVEFEDGEGARRSLAQFRGKVVLLNIWATWCAPCREEMPTLDRLQVKLGGPDFEVVALSIDQQGAAVARDFFKQIGIQALKLYVDSSAQAATKLGTFGLPTTLLIDREGREIGRHTGPAVWDAPEMVELLRRRIADGSTR
jgi:thiol-disulfide isomerase/thioredoxin